MSKRERWQFFFLWLFLGLVPLMLRPLWEPDEGRYAEIPREMLASGDWLTPRLNGVLYFEKPPLQYWLSAIAMKLFGSNALAARLPLALASGITLWCAWKLARRLGAREPMAVAFMTATSLLAFTVGQILTLDALFSALLLLSLTAAIEGVATRAQNLGPQALGWTLLAFGSNALALMTKGLAAPVLLGGILFASLPWLWRSPALRRAVLRTLIDPLGWLMFLILGAPWFILVDRVNPGHARFFFIHEHFARFSSTVHHRQGSDNPFLDKTYFLGILLLALLPWLTTSLMGLWRTGIFLRKRTGPLGAQAPIHRWTVATAFMAFLVPLAFFSLSGSKLPPYILPVLMPILALAAAFQREGEEPLIRKRCAWELVGLGAIFALAAPALLRSQESLGWVLGLGGAFVLLGCWGLRPRNLTDPRWKAALGTVFLLFALTAQKAAGPGKSVAQLVKQAPADAQWISAGNYFQGLPFYAKQRVAVVDGTGELAFGKDRLPSPERDRWFQEESAALNSLAQRMQAEQLHRPVWGLLSPRAWELLTPEERKAWRIVQGTPSAFLAQFQPQPTP